MLDTTSLAMFRRSSRLAGVSPFTLFLKDTKGLSTLANLSIAARGKALAKMFKALSDKERRSLQLRAASMASIRRRPQKAVAVAAPFKKHKPTAYNQFVRDQMQKVSGKPAQRLKQIAKLWASK